jgi:hypothetical protein
MGQRPRSRAVAIARQDEKQGRSNSGIPGLHVKARPMLRCVQEDFSEAAIGEATNRHPITDPVVLECQEFVSTAVW